MEERGPAPVIVSLGGNALIRRGQKGTIEEQFDNASKACSLISALSEAAFPLIVTHGNGPVVGNIVLRNEAASALVPPMPLYISGADSEGVVGYTLQQVIYNHLKRSGTGRQVAALITQVVVDARDPAFKNPTKPIGPFYAESEARALIGARGWVMKDDSGRGYRRVVASPRPLRIVESGVIERLASAGVIVIAAGGGGVPVVEDSEGLLKGVDAVVDKDLSTALLAISVKARLFIDLTSVEAVFLDFGKPWQRPVGRMSVEEAEGYLSKGHFAEGSMRPKIEAAIEFLKGGGQEAVITAPWLALEALEGNAGTRITRDS